MKSIPPIIPALVAVMALFAAGRAAAADYWVGPLDPAVVTNNDCGFISAAIGKPAIRRSFHAGQETSTPAYVADRIHSGDELSVPASSRLEWNCGVNTVVILGENSLARLGGLRSFIDPEGRRVARLDIQLTRGQMRVQVRQNDDAPEAVLVSMHNGAETLVARGDVAMYVNGSWQTAALAGEGRARIRRGGIVGAPFVYPEGVLVGANGQEQLGDAEKTAMKTRLPFSFEQARAALPPMPAVSGELEAP